MVVSAKTVNFDSISVGDELPTIQKSETQEDISDYLELNNRQPRDIPSANLHTDEKFSDKGIFGGMVNYGVTTCGFITELLQMAFPTRNITMGSLIMRALEPIRADDVVTYTGKVLDKRVEGTERLVEVEVTGTNQLGQTVAAAKATIPL